MRNKATDHVVFSIVVTVVNSCLTYVALEVGVDQGHRVSGFLILFVHAWWDSLCEWLERCKICTCTEQMETRKGDTRTSVSQRKSQHDPMIERQQTYHASDHRATAIGSE